MNEKKRLLAAALAEAEAAQHEITESRRNVGEPSTLKPSCSMRSKRLGRRLKRRSSARSAERRRGRVTDARTGGTSECQGSQFGVSWTETLGADPRTEKCAVCAPERASIRGPTHFSYQPMFFFFFFFFFFKKKKKIIIIILQFVISIFAFSMFIENFHVYGLGQTRNNHFHAVFLCNAHVI